MAKEIISASEKAFQRNLMPYTLKINDGTSIIVWARPYIDTTRVVRSSNNLREVEECDGDNIYVYRGRYYRYIPGSPFSQN